MNVMPTKTRLVENADYKLEMQMTQEVSPKEENWEKMCLYRVIFPGNKEKFLLCPENCSEEQIVGQAVCQLSQGKSYTWEQKEKFKESYICCDKIPVGMRGWGGQTF